jgi:glycerol-3-phosphate acyltransferase PlsY
MFLVVNTNDTLLCVLFILLSYILGSIPFGLLIGKLQGIDLRLKGSHNIGTTNATRVLGRKTGFFVGFCDSFKGILVIFLLMLLKHLKVWESPIDYSYYGLAGIIGHCYSIFIGFNGGKAVATTYGVAYLINPVLGFACNMGWLFGLIISGYVSLGSCLFAIILVIGSIILHFFGIESPTNFWEYLIQDASIERVIVFAIICLLIIIKHIPNIKRLLNGTEKGFKKHQKEKLYSIENNK